ncbi:MAG: DUF600 family protein [Firmicutes bacterium]|nr:DUF600 family protein [Bacillota bacterium]
MRIYIKGPDGKPLMPQKKEDVGKEEIREHIREILECVVELIPSEWSKTALYAEVVEKSVSFQIVYTSDGYAGRVSRAAEKNLYSGKIYEQRKTRLVDAVKRLYEKYAALGGRWEAMSVVFAGDGEYTAEFFESVRKDLTPQERIEKWKKDTLKVRQKTEKNNVSARSIEIHRRDDD